MGYQEAKIAFILWRLHPSVAVIKFFDPFFIGIKSLPLYADPVQIEIDFKEETSYSAVGIIKRVGSDKLLIEFDSLVNRVIRLWEQVRHCLLYFVVNFSGWSTLELLSGTKEHSTVFWILILAIHSCV